MQCSNHGRCTDDRPRVQSTPGPSALEKRGVDATTTTAGAGALLGLGFGMLLLYFIVQGLIIGLLARWALPGPDPMSYPKTILFGIGGSVLGGLVGSLLGDVGSGSALISLALSVAGAAALIWFFRRRDKRPPTA